MYDKRQIYETELKDLVKRILLICNTKKIPVILSFAVADNGHTTTYQTEMLSAIAVDTELTDDKIAKHAAVMQGFKVVPPHSSLDALLDVSSLESIE